MKKLKGICLSTALFMSGCSGALSASSNEEAAVNEKPKLEIMTNGEIGDYSRAAEQKIQVHDAAASRLFSVGKVDVKPEKEYTVMVYIVGSNLESRYGAASKDIDEMKQSGIDLEKTNLIIYTGGSRRWNSDIPSSKNSVIDLSAEDGISAQTEATADMGASQTLSEFVNYCTENYPAEHYGLILWDHGGGPLWGYGSDELFSNDSLILEEMQTAMDQTIFGKEKKLEFVGFDACLMGTLENAKLWEKYARYFVGSEELEAGNGWDYSFLNVMNETTDPAVITGEIVSTYGSYYENNKTEFYAPDATLTAVDLSQTENAITAVNALMDRMSQDIEDGNYAEINQAREKTKMFGLSAVSGKESAYDLLDLKHLAENLSERYPEEAQAVSSALENMIVAESTNVENTGGLSIYLPGDNSELAGLAEDLYTDTTILSTPYKDFISNYKEEWLNGGKTDPWALASIEVSDTELTLQLSEEQRKNTSSAYYTILMRNDQGRYAMTTGKVKIEPDENGVLHIPADPMLMTARTDMEESPVPWVCYEQESSETESSYQTLRTYLSTGHEFTDFDTDTDELVTITVKNKKGETETVIQDVSSAAGSAWLAGKGSVDVSRYETIIDTGGISLQPSRDENGRMLPYYDWNVTGYVLYPLSINNSFEYYMRPASDFGKDFICQVLIKDVNGNIHASDYVDLPRTDIEINLAEHPTEKGTLLINIYDDYAAVMRYEGEDTEVTIPSEAEGKPVKVIESGAFSDKETIEKLIIPDTVEEIEAEAAGGMNELKTVEFGSGVKKIGMAAFKRCEKLSDMILPEGLEQIGRAAFMNCNLKQVEIPSSVEMIGSIPFARNKELTEIRVASGNPQYQSRDGVLFTKDGKTLIQYPGAGAVTYAVPEGTETIGYGAFAEAPVEEVTFPETLKTIENDAFFECYQIKSLKLPESLESLGDLAFGEMRFLGSMQDGENHFDTVYLGKNLEHIGTDAFTALDNEKFEVSKENEKYASVGGMITGKAGDTILFVPMGFGKILQIPEGITTLTEGIFGQLPTDTQFILPDSVFRMAEEVFPYNLETDPETGKYVNVYEAVIHCSPGSAAEEYAETYGLQYDHNTDPEDMTYELKISETEEEVLVYRLYKKHAVLLRYRSAHEKEDGINLPAELEGVPVTELRAPDYEEYSGYSELPMGDVMNIPASVEKIDPEFLSAYYMQTVNVAEENQNYKSADGVLYSKDGKQLLYYPRMNKAESYTVADGTEVIGDEAFEMSYLKSVTFPDSLVKIGRNAFTSSSIEEVVYGTGLKEIGSYAFSGCSLKTIVLPEGLEKIGNGVFDLSETTTEFSLPASLTNAGDFCFGVEYNQKYETDTIRIGPKLKIGQSAFQELLFDAFEVDGENPYYKAEDGCLMSADGKELIYVPTKKSGEFHVPEGTETISYSAFDHCDLITDIYLPDSIVDLGNAVRKNYETDEYYYTIHCHEGTEAAHLLDAAGIVWHSY